MPPSGRTPFVSAIQLATRVLALSDVEVARYDNLVLRAGVKDQAIVLRAKALATKFGTALEPIETSDLKAITKDDDIYIYGHGGYAAGGRMILTATELAQTLHGRGLRAVRTLFLEGCTSGTGYLNEVVAAVELKGIKFHDIQASTTSTSTVITTGANLALTPTAQKNIDDMKVLDRLDPLGGFNQAAIQHEIVTGLVPIEKSGSLKVVRSLSSFDPYADLW